MGLRCLECHKIAKWHCFFVICGIFLVVSPVLIGLSGFSFIKEYDWKSLTIHNSQNKAQKGTNFVLTGCVRTF